MMRHRKTFEIEVLYNPPDDMILEQKDLDILHKKIKEFVEVNDRFKLLNVTFKDDWY